VKSNSKFKPANMKWSETISFDQPLREVALLCDAPEQNWDAVLKNREEAAYQRGRREGEASVNEQLLQQRTEIVELQRGILQSLSKALPQIVQESEAALICLALESAKRVVAGLPIETSLVEAVVREALRQAEDTAEIVIQLHPDDLALLRKNDSEILLGLPDKGPLKFVTGSEVTRGGCVVQTRFGLIDARREVKLEQLTQSLSS
jgi:flagellar assembly protein FliH